MPRSRIGGRGGIIGKKLTFGNWRTFTHSVDLSTQMQTSYALNGPPSRTQHARAGSAGFQVRSVGEYVITFDRHLSTYFISQQSERRLRPGRGEPPSRSSTNLPPTTYRFEYLCAHGGVIGTPTTVAQGLECGEGLPSTACVR